MTENVIDSLHVIDSVKTWINNKYESQSSDISDISIKQYITEYDSTGRIVKTTETNIDANKKKTTIKKDENKIQTTRKKEENKLKTTEKEVEEKVTEEYETKAKPAIGVVVSSMILIFAILFFILKKWKS